MTVLPPRLRLSLLWISQVARVLADWALRITAFLEVRNWGQQRDAAWYLVTAVFIAPFVLLAPFHGSISNALPKRWVLVASALACLLAVAAFVPTGGPWLVCLGVMALGAALYSPTRYAILPAASQDAHIPLNRVNGWIEMGGAAAIVGGIILGLQITGTVAASLPRGVFDERAGVWSPHTALGELPTVVMVILGLNALCLLTALPGHFPSDIRRPEGPVRALRGFFRDTRRIFADTEARGSLLAMAVFQGVVTAGSGAVFTLALAQSSSGRTDAMLSLILVCIGLALGCALASVRGHLRRSLGLVPLGLTGLFVAEVWAALASENGVAPAVPSFLLGMAGGLINVPLRSTYLAAVPGNARGNAMAVMNTIIYLIVTLIAVLMLGLVRTGVLATIESQLWFLVVVVGLSTLLAWKVLLAQTLEQFIEWFLWPMYHVRGHGPGMNRIPTRGPLLLIANHSSYTDPFWVAMVMPRHLRPMMTSLFFDLPVIRWLMAKVVRAIRVQDAIFRREAPELEEAIQVLRGGGSVLLFPEGSLRRKEETLLRQFGQGVWHILRAVPETPVVVLWIEGGWGSYASYKDGPPMKNKHLDRRRPINLAVTEPQVLAPSVLADQRNTRRYLMRACLEARHHLGLEVPPEALHEMPAVELPGPLPRHKETAEEEK
jgi:1-acyl-sn-glycerol-3-phosphate acyltransferase/MFS family permease